MQVWELMAELSKCKAGAEVFGSQGEDGTSGLETVDIKSDEGESAILTFAESTERVEYE